MAFGVPSTNMLAPASTEAFQQKSKLGDAYAISGTKFVQYGASTAYNTSTTETSVLNGSATTSVGSLTVPANGFLLGSNIPNGIAAGTHLRVKVYGTITNTSTPTLRGRFGIVNTAGTFTALADTTAITMTTITGTGDFMAEFDLWVSAMTSAATSSIVARGEVWYNATKLPAVATSTGSLDLTVPYSLDFRATWGTSSASNSIAVLGASVEVLN
jgi:hypothetical protein